MDFAPTGGPKAEEFLSKLSDQAKIEYGIEPEVNITELQEVLDDTRGTSEADSEKPTGNAGVSEISEPSGSE